MSGKWLSKNGSRRQESDGRVLVLVVDELDVLVTQTQSVLYNIFDWPTLPKRAILLSLVLRIPWIYRRRLLPKIASRLGSGRVTFNPYNTSELIKIIEARLRSTGDYSGDGKYDAITQNAVQLASMKVAQISGDAEGLWSYAGEASKSPKRGSSAKAAKIRR